LRLEERASLVGAGLSSQRDLGSGRTKKKKKKKRKERGERIPWKTPRNWQSNKRSQEESTADESIRDCIFIVITIAHQGCIYYFFYLFPILLSSPSSSFLSCSPFARFFSAINILKRRFFSSFCRLLAKFVCVSNLWITIW